MRTEIRQVSNVLAVGSRAEVVTHVEYVSDKNTSKDKKEPLEYHMKFLSWEIKHFYAFMHIIRIKEPQIRATVVGYTLKYFQKRMQ